jgi:hypothetical protein
MDRYSSRESGTPNNLVFCRDDAFSKRDLSRNYCSLVDSRCRDFIHCNSAASV